MAPQSFTRSTLPARAARHCSTGRRRVTLVRGELIAAVACGLIVLPMRLRVLGKSPSWQDAGGACSGYLLEEDGTAVLLDCGNGVFSKLRRYRDYIAVDAVLISHLHADHFLDLVPYSYALTYAPRQQPVPVDRWPGTATPARPLMLAPSRAKETFRRVVGAWGNEDLIENAFEIVEYAAEAQPQVGPLRFSFQKVPHFTE